jgi:hypothetical protein
MDLILFSFTLTEVASEFERSLDFWLRKLHPKGALLVLEPFSKPAKRRLERYRDRLSTEKQYRTVASLSSHQKRTWNLPKSMFMLNQNLNRMIDELNFTFLAVTPEVALPLSDFMLMTPFRWIKGKWIAAGRSSDGVAHEYEILARHVTPEIKGKLQKLKRGDAVRACNVRVAGSSLRFENLEEARDGKKRADVDAGDP